MGRRQLDSPPVDTVHQTEHSSPTQEVRWIDRFEYLVPSENPLLWTCINATIAVWSLLLLEMDYFASASSQFVLLAASHYIVYDFATTLLWVLQVGLNVLHDGWDNSNLESKIMVGIGILLLLFSAKTLFSWQVKGEEVDEDALWTAINLLAYLWETYGLLKLVIARQQFRVEHLEELEQNHRLRIRSTRYPSVVEAVPRLEVDNDWVGRGARPFNSSILRTPTTRNSPASPLIVERFSI